VKGVSAATLGRLVNERCKQPFATIQDFVNRVQPSAKEKRALAQSGAFNGLPSVEHRREALWQVELPFHDDVGMRAVWWKPPNNEFTRTPISRFSSERS